MNDILKKIESLSMHQKHLLKARMQKEGDRYGIYPLSSEQARMWYAYKFSPFNPYYNVVFTLELKKAMPVEEMIRAVRELVRENEMLHTAIIELDGEAYQAVLSDYHLSIQTIEEGEEYDITRKSIMEKEKNTPMDLIGTVPLRFTVIGNRAVVVTVHHIAIDGWSMGLSNKYLEGKLYGKASTDIKHSGYKDYVKWQQLHDYGEDLRYWEQSLQKREEQCNLPTDYPRTPDDDFQGDRVEFQLSAEEGDAIRKFALMNRVSVFSVFLSGFYCLLYHVCHQNRITVGTPVFNRPEEKFHDTIGCFANTIALILELDDKSSVKEVLKRVNSSVMGGLKHQTLPFEKLVERICRERISGIHPIFQVMFNMENSTLFQTNKSDSLIRLVLPETKSRVQFDVICGVMEENRGYQVGLAYKKSLFSKETMELLNGFLKKIINTMVTDEDILVDQLIDSKGSLICTSLRPYEKDCGERLEKLLLHSLPMKSIFVCYFAYRYYIFYTAKNEIQETVILDHATEVVRDKIAAVRLSSMPFEEDGELAQQLLYKQAKIIHGEIEEKGLQEKQVVALERKASQREYLSSDTMMKGPDRSSRQQTTIELPSDSSVKNSELDGGKLDERKHRNLTELLLSMEAVEMDNRIHTIQLGGKVESFCYRDLIERARLVAANLQSMGIQKGRNVVLQIRNLKEFMEVFWGCMLNGNVAVSLGLPMKYDLSDSTVQKIHNVCRLLREPILIGGSEEIAALTQLGKLENLRQVCQTKELYESQYQYEKRDIGENETAIILFTSGSTGVPKGVQLSHRNIIKRSQATSERYHFNSKEISLNWMPFDHVGGLVMYHILDVYNRATQIQVETQEILRDPLSWLKLLSDYKVTRTWAPNFAYGLIVNEKSKIRDMDICLKPCEFILNGGEAIHYDTCKEFMHLLKMKGLPENAMHPSWGMTETTSGVLFSDCFGDILYKNSVAVGTPIKGVRLKIVDDEGETVPAGEVGRLLIAGETINQGYYENEEENQRCFLDQSWFDTGDLCVLIGGEVVIAGRRKDVLIVNGANISCLEVEKSLEEIDEIMSGAIACLQLQDSSSDRDKIIVAYILQEIDEHLMKRLHGKITSKMSNEFGVIVDEFIPFLAEDMPRSSIGKIEKKTITQWYEEDKIKVYPANHLGDLLHGFCGITRKPRRLLQPGEVKKPLIVCTDERRAILEPNLKQLPFSKKIIWESLESGYGIAETVRENEPKEIYIFWDYDSRETEALLLISRLAKAIVRHCRIVFAFSSHCDTEFLVRGYLATLKLEERHIETQVLLHGEEEEGLKQLWMEDSSPYVAYEKGVRVVEELEPLSIDINWKKERITGKNMVILGGLGGIGQSLTNVLFEQFDNQVFVIGRQSEEAATEEWEELKSEGRLRYIRADAENAQELLFSLEEIHKNHRVDVIITLIGEEKTSCHWDNPENYYIRNQDEISLGKGIGRRIKALKTIDCFLQDKSGIEIYAMTSITAFLGGLSFGIYSAVSSWIFHRKTENQTNTYHCIASSKWKNIGMSAGESEELATAIRRAGMDVFQADSGVKSFLVLMMQEPERAIMGIDYQNYEVANFMDVKESLLSLTPYQDRETGAESGEDIEKMQAIWQEFLGKYFIAVDDKFFDVGGNSLKSIQLISKINDEFGTDLAIVDLFEYPTIRRLSGKIACCKEAAKTVIFEL